jgi:hypothetical protein
LLAGDLNVQQKYQRYLVPKKDMPDFFAKNRGKCQHAVVAIGYQANLTFTINHSPAPAYNTRTTAFDTIPGLFGVGIAFPKQVDSPEGVEYAIGVGKFWKIANDEAVLQLWNENTAPISRLSELQFGLFSTTG